jgi:hypothetical protein
VKFTFSEVNSEIYVIAIEDTQAQEVAKICPFLLISACVLVSAPVSSREPPQ